MRRARGLRVSSTRDVCIFCATRQLAIAESLAAPSQRRHLNSSSRAPQSAEGVIYKDANQRPRALSQAELMRQQLAASAAYVPPATPQAQGGYMSPAQRMKVALGQVPQQVQPQAQRQPPPDRRSAGRGGVFDGPGRNQSKDRFAPVARKVTAPNRMTTYNPPAPSMPQSRYKVNMESRPQVNMPTFGGDHLRRRNQGQSERAPQATRPPPRRSMLDQDEISQLLGNRPANRPPKPFQPLSREVNVQRTCWHCGAKDHQSFECPSKPVLRKPAPPQRQQPQESESIADAVQKWQQKAGAELEIERAPTVQEEADRRSRNLGQDKDRRRSRFDIDEPGEVKNRYEQPEKRRVGQARGRRVMREEEDEQDSERVVGKAERKRLRAEAKKAAQIAKDEPTPIYLPQYISVANLAGMLKLRAEDFVVKLEELGFEEVQNDHILNAEHAGLIAQEYNYEPVFQNEEEDGDLYPADEITPEEYAELPARPPVVTIMGHVDHGKTTILDYMRSTSVAATEFGGITQHIGAFSVPLANGKKITFLDTPGHSAFETMRARGANVTDIVVLVVAADDSVMPQTVEAIKHAQSANVPMIVAINKIDKSQADPDAVKLDLGRHGIEIEDFGGDVQVVSVSGKTGQGIPDLEEAISTLSELLDHRANPESAVEGWVLEGSTKKSGRVATVLVRSGTLRQGTALVAGTTWTRVRTLRNEAGVIVEEAGPGIAVEVDGWRDQPIAGDEVLQAHDEHQASSVSGLRMDKVEREALARDVDAINEFRKLENERREAEDAAEKALAAGEEELPAPALKKSGPEVVSFIIKGDVSGSVEAVLDSISSLGNADIQTRILRYGVGPPSEFDIEHAAAAQGHIVNFNTLVPPHVNRLAEDKGVQILDSNIIYRVVENVKELLQSKLKPEIIQKVSGEAEIAAAFEIGLGGRKKKMRVAGSKVRNGAVKLGSKTRVLRGEEVVFDGVISSLKNQKKDVETMRKDTECGISFEGWDAFKAGDRVQCYEEEERRRSL
ncbi:translation initiation factor-like protein IF-2 [Ophiobolus disseminans]|uniref:Translation initiation factor IF-2, mitochondrial n=1 Tax=Ophiobolus disseminans TaxID=1469910 RepID=A0A6A7A480_9PLEO|nr:translation initiation factor-like protein IF-2 [Ophiobolus disseminans]